MTYLVFWREARLLAAEMERRPYQKNEHLTYSNEALKCFATEELLALVNVCCKLAAVGNACEGEPD
jgi:hypothetical protein